MPLRRILRHFQIDLPDGKRKFFPGIHEVAEDVANHWFMLENSVAADVKHVFPPAKTSGTMVHIEGRPPMTPEQYNEYKESKKAPVVAPNPTSVAHVAPAVEHAQNDDAPIVETQEEKAEDERLAEIGVSRDDMLMQAEGLGVKVDKRWGNARLEAEIRAALRN